ncbi:MAG TPA: NYN domain-containing protein [Pseudonocardia sp.]|nr:NYN domain-containing protein [Pseudonocardia sp.]
MTGGAAPTTASPWDGLPEPVRARLAELAGAAVAGLPAPDVPAPLRRFARFTPAKRARLGEAALVGELRRSAAFRAAVVAWWDEHRPGELAVESRAGEPGDAAAAAVALLTDDPAAAEAVRLAGRRAEAGELRAERDAALARVEKLAVELERLREDLAQARAGARTADERRDAEFQQLRRRVGEQGARLRALSDALAEAEAEARAAAERAAAELAAARDQRDRERTRADAERRRADRAAAEVAAARQAAREARQADEVRLGLLVDTLSGALTGLRRELALGGGGPRPGDLVAGAGAARAGGAADTPAALDTLLAVPSLHLIVDGYNVTKTGYPELTLADQRNRLVGQLAALAARTGAEVTVVFDGAGVTAAPARGTRGVRVLFSDPGVAADDVIRALVAAEPQGRPVLVATSDRAVVASVREVGAHAVPSALLLARLGRG